MLKLPVEFKSSVSADGIFDNPWTLASGNFQAKCAVPKEFNGCGDGFSPEDLFLQALLNCFTGTFKVYAKASGIDFKNLTVNGLLHVDRGQNGKTIMKSAKFEIEINGCNRPDRARVLVAKAFRDGFILNSVVTELDYQLKIDGTVCDEAQN